MITLLDLYRRIAIDQRWTVPESMGAPGHRNLLQHIEAAAADGTLGTPVPVLYMKDGRCVETFAVGDPDAGEMVTIIAAGLPASAVDVPSADVYFDDLHANRRCPIVESMADVHRRLRQPFYVHRTARDLTQQQALVQLCRMMNSEGAETAAAWSRAFSPEIPLRRYTGGFRRNRPAAQPVVSAAPSTAASPEMASARRSFLRAVEDAMSGAILGERIEIAHGWNRERRRQHAVANSELNRHVGEAARARRRAGAVAAAEMA